jgi:hypothetical protein
MVWNVLSLALNAEQNPTQKRFTKGSSPMNAAIPVEEAYKILTDEKQNGHLVLLDAASTILLITGRTVIPR